MAHSGSAIRVHEGGASVAAGQRLTSVDALRGLVMVIMALDHARDFFHVGAMSFSPEDLSRTTPFLFFTRWVTHICAPVFMFLAGTGAFLRLERRASKAHLSWFLVTRGLWLVLVELTIMRLAMNFTADMRLPVLVLVLTALGLSMVALAALIHLPFRVLAGVSLAIVALHNLLDGIQPARFGEFAPVWTLLHQQGVVRQGEMIFVVAYPVLPWIGVMAAGFCAGRVYRQPEAIRRRVFLTTGVALIALFLAVRTLNVYGDPQPWSPQASPVLTLLSFLRTTKYPPSLAFILMTLGPALLLLAWFDRRRFGADHLLVAIGRVPFFYYVAHFWLLHVLASLMAWARYGKASLPYLFQPVPSMGGPRNLFPPDFGYPLWVTFVFWIATVALLYPLCRWFARVKAGRNAWWVSYV
jgi:uncharacterized membrane protein